MANPCGYQTVLNSIIKPYLKEREKNHSKDRDILFREIVQKLLPHYNGTFFNDAAIEQFINRYKGPTRVAAKKFQILNCRNIDVETKKKKTKDLKDIARNCMDQKWKIDGQLFTAHFRYLIRCYPDIPQDLRYDLVIDTLSTKIQFQQAQERPLIKVIALYFCGELQSALSRFCDNKLDLKQLKLELKKTVTPPQFAARVMAEVKALKNNSNRMLLSLPPFNYVPSPHFNESMNRHVNDAQYYPPIQYGNIDEAPTGYDNVHGVSTPSALRRDSPYHMASPITTTNNNMEYYDDVISPSMFGFGDFNESPDYSESFVSSAFWNDE